MVVFDESSVTCVKINKLAAMIVRFTTQYTKSKPFKHRVHKGKGLSLKKLRKR